MLLLVFNLLQLFHSPTALFVGFKMKKRVGDVEEFEFEDLTMGNSLHITIAITGWLSKDVPTFTGPWAPLAHSREQVTTIVWVMIYLGSK